MTDQAPVTPVTPVNAPAAIESEVQKVAEVVLPIAEGVAAIASGASPSTVVITEVVKIIEGWFSQHVTSSPVAKDPVVATHLETAKNTLIAILQGL